MERVLFLEFGDGSDSKSCCIFNYSYFLCKYSNIALFSLFSKFFRSLNLGSSKVEINPTELSID